MTQLPVAGLTRRIAAGLYDTLLVAAVMMLITLLILVLHGGEPVPPGNRLYQLILLLTTAAFFVGFWSHGGQTLGMRTWRIRVERRSGEALGWPIALLRFAAALVSLAALGLGFLWLLIDRDGLTWHDRMADTRVVVLPKREKNS